MRGLDQALKEVRSARNRVSRLFGLSRLSKQEMLVITDKLQEAEDLLVKAEEINIDVHQGATSTITYP